MPTDNRSIDSGRSSIRMSLLAMMMAFSVMSPVQEEDETEERQPEAEPLKLSDLTQRPLLHICEYLRTNERNTALDAFRKTCRYFAATVNTFLECPKNLPEIRFMKIHDKGHKLCLTCYMPCVDYPLHPIATLEGGSCDHERQITTIRRRLKNDEIIDHVSTVLIGAVGQLLITCGRNVVDLARMHRVFKNLKNDYLRIECTTLTDQLASDILQLVKKFSATKFNIEFRTSTLTNPLAFITAINAATPLSGAFEVYGGRWFSHLPGFIRTPLLGQSDDFWRAFLDEKQAEGCQVGCDARGFSAGLRGFPMITTPFPYMITWTNLRHLD